MSARTAEVSRATLETRIDLRLALDGSGRHGLASGVAFLDHMLAQVARHGLLDLELTAEGDLAVDAHHTVEDVGIVLGQAFDRALADRAGIQMEDVLLEINGQPISRPQQVLILLGQKSPGDEVFVTVLRNGRQQTMQVTLAGGAPLPQEGRPQSRRMRDARRPGELGSGDERQPAGQIARPALSQNREAQDKERPDDDAAPSFRLQGGWLGVAVEPGGEDIEGLRVKRVFPGGPAARAGIRKDDILLEIDRQLLSEHDDLAKALEGTRAGEEVAVRLTRGPNPKLHEQTKFVRLGESTGRQRVALDEMKEQERAQESVGYWEDSQGFATQIPPGAYELEYQRRMAEQNERLERLLIDLSEEMQQLRQEVATLKAERAGNESLKQSPVEPRPSADNTETTPDQGQQSP